MTTDDNMILFVITLVQNSLRHRLRGMSGTPSATLHGQEGNPSSPVFKVGEVAPWVKVLASKVDDLGSHITQLNPPRVYLGICTHPIK